MWNKFPNNLIVLLGIIAMLVGTGLPVAATDGTGIAQGLDLTQLNRFVGSLDADTVRYLPKLDPKDWGNTGPKWNIAAIGRAILLFFLREVVFNFRLLGEMLLLAMALAILQNLQHAFESTTLQQIAFGLCFLIVIGIVMNSFRVTFGIAREAIGEITGAMYAILPVMFTLITAGGGINTTVIVHPLLISAVGVVAGLVNYVVFPLILFAGVLGLVNYLSEAFQTKKLAQLFKKSAVGLMGLTMAGFVGIVSIRGFTAAVADSTVLRTGKYFSKNFLPVVGGELADTLEMAIGCSLVLKSGIGLFGMGLVLLIAVFPLVKILAVAMVFNLTGAILQPLGNNRLADALETVGETFYTLFGALAVVSLMFFIAIAILVGLANQGVM